MGHLALDAQAASLWRFHLLPLFKATFNVSPLEYADRRRVDPWLREVEVSYDNA
jgi:methylphosphotriester-DNA--protein-cysteine methyltransferase